MASYPLELGSVVHLFKEGDNFIVIDSFSIAEIEDIIKTFELASTVTEEASGLIKYENDYMRIEIPSGWVSTPVVKNNAVNITKGNYILYINPVFTHASGVIGGRAGDIEKGAPSVDLVTSKVVSYDILECVSNIEQRIVHPFRFGDYYTSDFKKEEYACNLPDDLKPAWFFSGSAGRISDLPLEFKEGILVSDREYAITMALQTNDVNKLPKKGNTELGKMIAEMSTIAKTIVFK